jgi:hypothetical protein
MGLKEKAFDAYKRDRELIDESNIKEAENFAIKSLERLREVLGNDEDIITVDKQPGATTFSVDGILFRVNSSDGYHVVNVVKKCSVCGTDNIAGVLDIKDIGRALAEPHSKYDCDRMLEIKKSNESGDKVLSTEERLLEALREFIRENDNMGY